MLDLQQKLSLLISLLPYLGLAAYDGYLHKEARQVPRVEQAIHGALLISVLSLLWGLFLDRPGLVLPAIGLFCLFGLSDELGFHGALSRQERRLHYVAYSCFAGFVVIAARIGAFT